MAKVRQQPTKGPGGRRPSPLDGFLEAEGRAERILGDLPLTVSVIDPRGEIRYTNSRDAALPFRHGASLFDAVAPDGQAHLLVSMDRLFDTGERAICELPLVGAKGLQYWYECHAQAVTFDEDVLGAIVGSIDITSRKMWETDLLGEVESLQRRLGQRLDLAIFGDDAMSEAQSRLHAALEHGRLYVQQLRMLLEQLPVITWCTDKQLRFTRSAGSGLYRVGGTPNRIIGLPVAEYFGSLPNDHPVILAHRAALDGIPGRYVHDWRDTAWKCYVEPLFEDNDVIAGVVGLAYPGEINGRLGRET